MWAADAPGERQRGKAAAEEEVDEEEVDGWTASRRFGSAGEQRG